MSYMPLAILFIHILSARPRASFLVEALGFDGQAQLVLELVLSCLRISASTSDMRRSVASRVHSSAWSLRHRGAKRANACMRWMSRWSGGTRARAPIQVQGRRVR